MSGGSKQSNEVAAMSSHMQKESGAEKEVHTNEYDQDKVAAEMARLNQEIIQRKDEEQKKEQAIRSVVVDNAAVALVSRELDMPLPEAKYALQKCGGDVQRLMTEQVTRYN